MESKQDRFFLERGGDEYFDRNHPSGTEVAPTEDHPLVQLFAKQCQSRTGGRALVVGGGVGREAAEFQDLFPDWQISNLDISSKAIETGRVAFPQMTHIQASITAQDFQDIADGPFDVVLVCATLHWIDCSLLTRAIGNIDRAVADGGVLGIYDFYPPRNIRREVKYSSGIFTYEQNYAETYLSLGV